jgi:hypothetical protein
MSSMLFAVLAIALVAAVLALGREVRLRKALEKLLRILLSRWRAHVSKTENHNTNTVDSHPDANDRLQR